MPTIDELQIEVDRYRDGNTVLIEVLMNFVKAKFKPVHKVHVDLVAITTKETVDYYTYRDAEEKKLLDLLCSSGFADKYYAINKEFYKLFWDKLEERKQPKTWKSLMAWLKGMK